MTPPGTIGAWVTLALGLLFVIAAVSVAQPRRDDVETRTGPQIALATFPPVLAGLVLVLAALGAFT